jgi:polar amino acid transport system substrate-binding protein
MTGTHMRRLVIPLLLMGLSTACAESDEGVAATRDQLAPTGTLRAGVLIGNPVLAMQDAGGGEPRGVAADISREIGRRLGVPVAFVTYGSAAAITDAATAGGWDVAFLAADPARADAISFTPPYLELEATYLVPAASALGRIEDVDAAGTRIAARPRSAYDLFLRRSLTHARLVYPEEGATDADLLIAGKADVLAGLRDVLIVDASRPELTGARLLDGHFALMQQAIGVPKGRDVAAAWLNELVEEIKTNGLVAQAIRATGARGARVAG